MDAVVNKDMNRNRQESEQLCLGYPPDDSEGQAVAMLFHSLRRVYTDIDGEGWSWVPGCLKEACF